MQEITNKEKSLKSVFNSGPCSLLAIYNDIFTTAQHRMMEQYES
jgi:hypothetical protein